MCVCHSATSELFGIGHDDRAVDAMCWILLKRIKQPEQKNNLRARIRQSFRYKDLLIQSATLNFTGFRTSNKVNQIKIQNPMYTYLYSYADIISNIINATMPPFSSAFFIKICTQFIINYVVFKWRDTYVFEIKQNKRRKKFAFFEIKLNQRRNNIFRVTNFLTVIVLPHEMKKKMSKIFYLIWRRAVGDCFLRI